MIRVSPGLISVCVTFFVFSSSASPQTTVNAQPTVWVLKPTRVFDGTTVHDNWLVVVRAKKIERAGPLKDGVIYRGGPAK